MTRNEPARSDPHAVMNLQILRQGLSCTEGTESLGMAPVNPLTMKAVRSGKGSPKATGA